MTNKLQIPNVVLIYPQISGIINDRPPLSLLYLAASLLEHGFEVRLIDETVQTNAKDLLAEYIDSDTVCAGISSLTGPQLTGAVNTAKTIRKLNPELPIVWGGRHPSIDHAGPLDSGLADAVCIGEGEVTFIEMVKAYVEGCSMENVRGIALKVNGKLLLTGSRAEYYDINKLPPLPYDLLDLDLYRKKPKEITPFWGFKEELMLSVETSRGCPYSCAYCLQAVKNEKFRKMSPETIIKFLERIVAKGVKGVAILDDNFFSNPKHAKKVLMDICNRKWGLKIFVAVRSDYLSGVDNDTLELIRDAGIKMLAIGVESGSDRILEKMNKKEKIEVTFEANRKLAKAGIYAWFHFISGFPWERLEDAILSCRAYTRILKENPYARVTNNKLMPFYNTPVYEDCVASGMPREKTLEQWADIMDTTWSKHVDYLDKEVVEWSRNTFYYQNAALNMSFRRSPEGRPFLDFAKAWFSTKFYFWSWIVGLRCRYKIHGYFIDNAIFSLQRNTSNMIRWLPAAIKHSFISLGMRLKALTRPLWFGKRFSRNLNNIPRQTKRVLILGSSRPWHIKKIFAGIFNLVKYDVGFLCSSLSFDEYRHRFSDVRYFTTKSNGFLQWEKLEPELKKELVDYESDIVIIPTMETDPDLIHQIYANIYRIAKSINPKEIFFVNSEGNVLADESLSHRS